MITAPASAKPQTDFTAAEIASALGRSRAAIRQALENVPPVSHKLIAGNVAPAWPLASLPASMQNDLAAIATAKGFRDAGHLLAEPDALWLPSISLADSSVEAIDKAVKRRQWLTPFLPLAKDAGFVFAAIEAELIASHQKIFGYALCGKSVREIFNEIVKERDRGREDWQRLEIYLDAQRGRKPGVSRRNRQAKTDREYNLSPIAEALAALENPAAPSLEDREFIFDASFRCYETLNAEYPGEERHVKRAVIRYLSRAVPLAKSLESLERTYKAKLAQWAEGGRCPSALSDRRRLDSGNFRRPDFKADAEKIRNLAILHGGNESLAHRLAWQRGELSPEYTSYFSYNPRQNKSYVPATVRDEITPDVEMCGPLHRGPHEARMRGPYIQRDWSDVQPGQWFNADDVTWNSYFYFTDPRGQLQITRGECLLFIDLRTGYPLDFSLIAGKYNGEHIRIGIHRVHDLHGLPSKGFYLERGVWKSRLIVGETDKNLVHWRNAERGLREYGLDMAVRHATTPRAKPIEGLLRILQERQRSELGFVGFNERLEKMERVQDIIARCKRGTEDPRNHFLSQQEWSDRISKCLGEYLHDPQNGKMLDGQSPAEMWETRQPLAKLPDEARYILSTHRVRAKVRQEGIVLTIRGKRLAFYNEQTGAMIGRDVFAFYNIEQPELLTVSDVNRQNFFTVKNHTLPAMSASKEQFGAVNADRAGHMHRAKVIYGSIPHPERKFIVRDNAVDDESKDLGRFHNAATHRFQQDKAALTNARSNRLARGRELLNETSVEIPAPVETPKKVYILDPAPAVKPSTGLYWALWAKVEKIKPGTTRQALTQKAIGGHSKPQEMTPDQLAKMIDVFSAIIRDHSSALAK